MLQSSDTVHLRRTITLKEDKFKLDSRYLNKREVRIFSVAFWIIFASSHVHTTMVNIAGWWHALFSVVETITQLLYLYMTYSHEPYLGSTLLGHLTSSDSGPCYRCAVCERSALSLQRCVVCVCERSSPNARVACDCLQVQNVLEAAGFSRTNPYNIVQQGKIAQMAKLSDEERLNLLKEVGGASVYEDKRKESHQTLERQKAQVQEVDTTVSSSCILHVPCIDRSLQGLVHGSMTWRSRNNRLLVQLQTISARLEKLESERQELLEYQRLDRKRRAIEYCILDSDRAETIQQINKVSAVLLQ